MLGNACHTEIEDVLSDVNIITCLLSCIVELGHEERVVCTGFNGVGT